MERTGQVLDGFSPLRGVTGLACRWQLALPRHLKCWCLWLERNWRLPKGQGHNSSLPHCAPGRALLLRAHQVCNACPPPGISWETRAPHVTNRSLKHSASPSSQGGQEPCPVGGPQAAHSSCLLTSVAHTQPPQPLQTHLQATF